MPRQSSDHSGSISIAHFWSWDLLFVSGRVARPDHRPEDFVIALLATASDQQLELARNGRLYLRAGKLYPGKGLTMCSTKPSIDASAPSA
jgi:hypothetical protein